MATSTTPPLVLVVDDSWTELTWMANALQANGYRVITANDGDEALAKVLAERPDCVILDVVLPKQNGFQCAAG
jgi:DNA-binding response OmpR family regulator